MENLLNSFQVHKWQVAKVVGQEKKVPTKCKNKAMESGQTAQMGLLAAKHKNPDRSMNQSIELMFSQIEERG